MRSVLVNRVDEFLKILSYDKGEWRDFWKRLKRRFKPLLDGYEKCIGIDWWALENIRRMDLDRFRRDWEKFGSELRRRAGYEIRTRSEELQLSKQDFSVMLISGFGTRECCVVDGKKEKVILVDVFAVWREDLSKLPEVVLWCVRNFRGEG